MSDIFIYGIYYFNNGIDFVVIYAEVIEIKKLDMTKNQHKTILFLHIPKTAGTTLDRIIDKQYDRSKVFSNSCKVLSSLGNYWMNFSVEDREEISRKSLIELPKKEKEEIKVIKGHMHFGWHEYINKPCTYITVLRDPVDRVISLYYYILRSQKHHLNRFILSNKMSLKDFVRSGISTTVDNGQTRILSGIRENVEFGDCSIETLSLAKNNIQEHFSLVGLTERFDETLVLSGKLFGWENLSYKRLNVTNDRPLKREISKDTLKCIEDYCKIDIELYDFCKKKLEDAIKEIGYPFHFDINILKIQNYIYNNRIYHKVMSL